MNGANYFIFYYSSSRRKYSIYIFKAAHERDEWNSNWRENTEEENYKKIPSSVKDITLNTNL